MKSIQIPIPKGYEFHSFNTLTGEVQLKELKPKNVMERLKSVADVLADHGYTQQEFDKQNEELTDDEIAYRIIKLLAKSLNEGWTPDWDDSSQYKYYPWFYMQGGSSGFRCGGCGDWRAGSGVGSRLCFKSAELAKYAGTQFTDVYKKFMTL